MLLIFVLSLNTSHYSSYLLICTSFVCSYVCILFYVDLSPVVCRANRVSESNRSRGATEGSARRVEKASYGRPISTATAGASTANSVVSPAPGRHLYIAVMVVYCLVCP